MCNFYKAKFTSFPGKFSEVFYQVMTSIQIIKYFLTLESYLQKSGFNLIL